MPVNVKRKLKRIIHYLSMTTDDRNTELNGMLSISDVLDICVWELRS